MSNRNMMMNVLTKEEKELKCGQRAARVSIAMSETLTAKDKSSRNETEQNFTVALRVRPLNEDEIIQGATPVAHAIENTMVVLMDPLDDPDDVLRVNRSREKTYVFDIAFDGSATQKEVYDQTTKSLIPNVIDGYNATVFAYGATGAGKTYTMLGTDDEPGIMAQALNDLFTEMARSINEMTYKVTMSYLEIYNEMIRDLLNPSSGYLELREDAKGVQVAGLTEISTQSTREVMNILFQGNKERTSEPTAANKTSSRSHAVLQISVQQRNRIQGFKQEVRQGRLFLIDLAGSERAANTRNKGKRMVEGAHINRSLLALGNCINALSEKTGSRYVNYRDSKLTRLLKDALGGNCRTVMIAHVSPASIHFEESRNTLLYADRAKNIKTKVRRNVLDVSYHISQYANIISELREEIKRLKVKLDTSTKHSAALTGLEGGSSEMHKLKERLVSVFREQMEIRRSLMDLNNTAMEISLDVTRNKLVLKKWEREKGLTSRKRALMKDTADSDTTGPDNDAVFLTESKELELRGESPSEPEEVKVARDDLDALMREKGRTDKIRSRITSELEAARDRATKIEEMLPHITSSAHQQEVLSLLCRVHELEIDNMEMQSACLLRNFEIRKIDMAVMRYEQHRQLCDDIIQQQRSLLEEKDTDYSSRELEELYDLYDQERGDMLGERKMSLPGVTGPLQKTGSISNLSRKLLDIDSMSDFTAFDPVGADTESVVTLPRIFTPGAVGGSSNIAGGASSVAGGAKRPLFRPAPHSSMTQVKEENTSALFSHSPRAKELLREQAQEDPLSPRSSLQPHQGYPNGGAPRKESIITLSSDSTPPPQLPPQGSSRDIEREAPVLSSRDSLGEPGGVINPQQRQIIATSTRNIAALALQRRSKASLNEVNSLQRDRLQHIATRKRIGYLDHHHMATAATKASSDNKLTESRLAMHDRKYLARQAFEDVVASDQNVAVGRESRSRNKVVVGGKAQGPGMVGVGGRTGGRYSRATRQGGYPTRQQQSQPQQAEGGAWNTPQTVVQGSTTRPGQGVASYQQLSKSSPRRAGGKPTTTDSPHGQHRSRLPTTTTNKENLPKEHNNLGLHSEEAEDDVVELKSSQDKGLSTVVQQRGPEKGRGQTLTRKVKGPRVKKSTNFPNDFSKPEPKGKNRNSRASRKQQPTIPSYGTADIGISGFSLQ